MILSTASTCTIEDVAAVGGRQWFQLYVYADRGLTQVARRARGGMRHGRGRAHRRRTGARAARARSAQSLSSAGGSTSRQRALVRQRSHAHRAWRVRAWGRISRAGSTPRSAGATWTGSARSRVSPSSSRGSFEATTRPRRSITERPASSCRTTAAVSSTPRSRRSARCRRSSTRSLVACEVLLDGGIRRGTDVIKAIALGARAVLVGRPVVWGLAAGGEAGATTRARPAQGRGRSRDGAMRMPDNRRHFT